MRTYIIFILLFLSSFYGSSVIAQQPKQQLDPELTWLTALDLWNKEKFAAAQKYFIEAGNLFEKNNSQRWTDCHFYSAYCALKLYNKDAEFRFRRFLELHPEDSRDDLVYFLMGKYQFERKDYTNTLEWFEKIDLDGISDEDLPDYYYYKGFSLFKTDNYKEAQLSFSHNLIETDPFYYPAVYYTAFIDYSEKHYEIALERFLLLEDQEGFSELVPYYISQIYFLQKRYKDLIDYAEPWMEKVETNRKSEMSRLLAEAYYYEANYQKSVDYFSAYFASPSTVTRDDYYAYGYGLYKTNEYDLAITQFNRMINEKDELTQVALLNMGDCYLKLEKFKNAQNAFKNASQYDFDPTIKEEAFFNYAKLSYQLSFDPYDEAIQAFETYLDTYPHSAKKDEAYIFLVNVYMKTKNYQSALTVIDKIPNPDYTVKSAYQIAVYNIAVEYYQQKNYDEAIRWFQNVSKYDFEKVTLAESYFWLGELKFKKKNYRGAIESYSMFFAATQSYQSEYFSRGYYGQAYAQLKLNAYEKALENYFQFIHFDKGRNVKLIADAEQRIGDIYFLQKKYDQSINYFTTAISKSEFDKDYALYQIAMSQGYLGKIDNKIDYLYRLIEEVPESVYRPQALFEIASSYFEVENYQMALDVLKELEDNYPNSTLIADTYLKRGLIYIKMHDDSASRDAFLYVFENYPNSKASNEALISLKEVDLATFTRLAKETGYAGISEEDVDAANFEEAEESYLNGKYERSSLLLGHYLNGFPNGRFRQNAHFYKADCHVRMQEKDSALTQFEYLLGQPGNPYFENALYMSATLSRELSKTDKMYTYYQMLYQSSGNKQYQSEALNYLIITGYQKEEYLKVIQWAEIIRSDEKRQDTQRQNAMLYEVNSYLKLGEKTKALNLINQANYDLRDETTAELSYLKALLLYEEGNYTESEAALYFLLQNFGSFGEWRARGFILLGDVYVSIDDPFQAKATWQSVIDHHKGADLVAIAQKKLDHLIQTEADENHVEEAELEIDFVKPIATDSASYQNQEIEILQTDSIND